MCVCARTHACVSLSCCLCLSYNVVLYPLSGFVPFTVHCPIDCFYFIVSPVFFPFVSSFLSSVLPFFFLSCLLSSFRSSFLSSVYFSFFLFTEKVNIRGPLFSPRSLLNACSWLSAQCLKETFRIDRASQRTSVELTG